MCTLLVSHRNQFWVGFYAQNVDIIHPSVLKWLCKGLYLVNETLSGHAQPTLLNLSKACLKVLLNTLMKSYLIAFKETTYCTIDIV